MKKIVVAVMCLVLMLSLSVTSFAAAYVYPPVPESISGHNIGFAWLIDEETLVCSTWPATIEDGELLAPASFYCKVIDDVWVMTSHSNGVGFATPLENVLWTSNGMVKAKGVYIFYNPIDSDAWQAVYDNYTAQINGQSVLAVLAVGATAIVGLVFMWWGVRKLARGFMRAFRKGRVSV